jgi:hypothetical protein
MDAASKNPNGKSIQTRRIRCFDRKVMQLEIEAIKEKRREQTQNIGRN